MKYKIIIKTNLNFRRLVKDNLPKIKDGAYAINLDEYESIRTHWIALYVNGDNVTYFDSYGVVHIQKEITKFVGNKNIKTNIYRIQANDPLMCRYSSISFTKFILKCKSLLDHINFIFS